MPSVPSFFSRTSPAIRFDQPPERMEGFERVVSPDCPEETKVSIHLQGTWVECPACLQLDYTVKGGTFHGASFPLREHAGTIAGLSFDVRGETGRGLFVRLTDATGQEHNCAFTLRGGRERVEWLFHRTKEERPFMASHAGGADDGLIHLPLQRILFGPGEAEDARGGVSIVSVEFGETLVDRETVTVDAANVGEPPRYVGSGFLHGITTNDPPDEFVAPLKPQLFRGRLRSIGGPGGYNPPEFFKRMERWGAQFQALACSEFRSQRSLARAPYQVVMSDEHGPQRVKDGPVWPGDDGDWSIWERTIHVLVEEVRRLGVDVEWDIWNEPNYSQFWKSTRERWLETWRRGVTLLRELEPDAVVIGPSFSTFDRDYIERFLRYAKEHDVLPSILCWHELTWLHRDHRAIVEHADCARAMMKRLGIPELPIDINEYCVEPYVPNVGAHGWYLAGIEAAGIRGTCHAIWNEPERTEDAPPVNLCNLLTADRDPKPRALWWFYRAYADLAGRMTPVAPGPSVNGVASVDAEAGTALALLGRDEDLGNVPVTVRVEGLTGGAFAGAKRVRVTAERIPYNGRDALDAPVKTVETEVALEAGALELTLPGFGYRDGYVVRVTAG